MARVNHKLVKQRLNEKRSKITDRQFFTSRLFAGHLEDLAAAQTRRYHYNRRVRVNIYWNSKDSFFAATDNMSVKINAGHPFITKTKGRENRYQMILGVFAHELGHILYTDFLAQQTHYNYLGSYKWYPYPPVLTASADARREKAFWEYVKEDAKNLEMAQHIAQYISNLIDDGYVEDRILANFPGKLGYGLEELREIHFEQIPTVTELIEKEDTEDRHIFESIAQIMLSYAKFGEIKYGEEPLSEERIQVVFSLINDIDAALMSRSGKERLAVVNTIIVRCWDYLEEFCEECKKRQEEAEAAGGTASIAQTMSEKLQSIAGSSTAGTGSSSPVPDGSGESESSATAKAREKTHEDAEDGEDCEGSGSGSEGKDENSSSQTDSEIDEKSSESGGGGEKIIFFFLDEPQILVGKDKKHLDAMDTSDSTVKYIPYKESECGEAAGLTAGIAYPENWQEQVGVSYEIKQQRGRVLDAVSSADIRNHGTKVVNPFIGVIPTHGELEDELEQIYEAM